VKDVVPASQATASQPPINPHYEAKTAIGRITQKLDAMAPSRPEAQPHSSHKLPTPNQY
jgi:hypothetical protein